MTVPLVSPAAEPPLRVRLRPAPALEPPFDDEADRFTDAAAAAGPRRRPALAWSQRAAGAAGGPVAPAVPLPRVAPRLDEDGPEPPADPLPDPRLAIRLFLELCMEVLTGRRPIRHLRPYATPDGLLGVETDLTPANRSDRGPRDKPARVRLVRVTEPAGGVVEAAVVVDRGGLAWAMAVRMEWQDGRWLCSFLQVV